MLNLSDKQARNFNGALRKAGTTRNRYSIRILAAGYEGARLSPKARNALRYLAFYAAAEGLDLAGRNTRVLARSAVSAMRSGEAAPDNLTEAVRDLARSAEALAVQLEEPARATGTGHFALEAAGKATTAFVERNDLETNMLSDRCATPPSTCSGLRDGLRNRIGRARRRRQQGRLSTGTREPGTSCSPSRTGAVR
jgi:hypothetical protein